MKRTLLIVTILVFITTANGQILNGSFENDSTSDLSDWENRCYDLESSNITPPDGGNWSIRVWGGDFQGCFPSYAYQKIPNITNGQSFILSGWVLGQSASLKFGKINHGVKTILSGSNNSSDSWTKLNHQSTFELTEGDTAIVILYVSTSGGGASSNGNFDLIKLEQVQGISPLDQTFSLRIFPNPFQTQTTIQTNKFLHNATLTLNNSFGHVVKRIDNISSKTIILERANLPNGLYYIQLSENNRIIASKKLLIIE